MPNDSDDIPFDESDLFTDGEDFGDDPFGDLFDPRDVGIHRVKSDPPEIRLAKEVLKDKGRLIFHKIAADKNGEVYQVVRRKGEARPGLIKHDGKQWRFYPQMNFHFNVEELDEIADFMETLI